jgi:hypothetical protein
MIIGYEWVSTTEPNLGLRYDDLKPAYDASVDVTNAGLTTKHLDWFGGRDTLTFLVPVPVERLGAEATTPVWPRAILSETSPRA